jgi:hypothetical protein
MIELPDIARIAGAWPGFENCRIEALPGEIDLNFKLTRQDGACFVLKIAHPDTPLESLDFQNKLLQHLEKQALPLQLPQVIPNQKGETIHLLEGEISKPDTSGYSPGWKAGCGGNLRPPVQLLWKV